MHVARTIPHLCRLKKLVVGPAHILARLRQHLLNGQFACHCTILLLLGLMAVARVGVASGVQVLRLLHLGLELLLVLLLQPLHFQWRR